MKKHISYPKIGQFRNVIKDLKYAIAYDGRDEEGNAKYNFDRPLPKIIFDGTIKLHGTNAGICYNALNGFWFQSRNNIITVENDNAGFARFASDREEILIDIVNYLIMYYQIEIDKNTICIYGEWAGKGIQKGVGVSELDKAFYVFGLKVVNNETEESEWLEFDFSGNADAKIFNIKSFETFQMEIDLSKPELSQNLLIAITEEIEKECPVAKAFDVEGVGEGAVWRCRYAGKQFLFKVKGEKHSVSKVKKLASVDVEKVNSINEFVEYSVTTNRFSQALENVFSSEDLDVKKLGDVIRWIANDIMAEEMDTLEKNRLTWKDVARAIAKKTREEFFKHNV